MPRDKKLLEKIQALLLQGHSLPSAAKETNTPLGTLQTWRKRGYLELLDDYLYKPEGVARK